MCLRSEDESETCVGCDFGTYVRSHAARRIATEGGKYGTELEECSVCENMFHVGCAGVDGFSPGWMCYGCWCERALLDQKHCKPVEDGAQQIFALITRSRQAPRLLGCWALHHKMHVFGGNTT